MVFIDQEGSLQCYENIHLQRCQSFLFFIFDVANEHFLNERALWYLQAVGFSFQHDFSLYIFMFTFMAHFDNGRVIFF